MMATYEITDDGRLMQTAATFETLSEPEFIALTGDVEFYNSNAVASAFGHLFTRDGEDYQSVTYEARFVGGCVQAIIETEHKREPALSSAFYRKADEEIDKDEPDIKTDEPEIGATLWRLWGGFDREAYPVTLLAKTEVEWALSDGKGRVEKEYPFQLGNILFCSEQDAQSAKWWRKESWERKARWCNEQLANRDTATK